MTTFYYAQINESGICHSVGQTAGEIIADDMILIDSYDESKLGKLWDGQDWVEPPTE